MIIKVINGQLRSVYSKKELEEQGGDNMGIDKDILLESLRVNLEKVQKDKMLLENKEIEIKKQIDKITQGE